MLHIERTVDKGYWVILNGEKRQMILVVVKEEIVEVIVGITTQDIHKTC